MTQNEVSHLQPHPLAIAETGRLDDVTASDGSEEAAARAIQVGDVRLFMIRALMLTGIIEDISWISYTARNSRSECRGVHTRTACKIS